MCGYTGENMQSEDLINQPPVVDTDRHAPASVADEVREYLASSTGSSMAAPVVTASQEVFDKEDAAIKAAMEELDKSPQERYRAALEKENIPLKEALGIIDCIVVTLRQYEETIKITDSVSVTFRTRTLTDQARLNRALEKEMPQYRTSIEFEIARQHLASSIVRYGDRVFPNQTPEDVQKTLAWLSSIPQPAFTILQRKLYDFDRKINTVFSEGYLENFYPTLF
jgi:hypothetical protein